MAVHGHCCQYHPGPLRYALARAQRTSCVQAAIGNVETPLQEAFALACRHPMGLTWLRAPLNGHVVFNLDSRTAGFSSSLWLDPERNRAGAVLANALVEVHVLALRLLDESVRPKDLAPAEQLQIALSAAVPAPLPASRRSNRSSNWRPGSHTSTRSMPPSLARFTYSGIQSSPRMRLAISTTM